MLKGEIVKEALLKFPNTPSNTLAQKIYKENMAVFRDKEDVRRALRYYRGQCGNKDRINIANKDFIQPPAPLNPFDALPEGLKDYNDWSIVQLDCKKALVLADTHIPYHDKEALKLALNYGKQAQIDCIVWLGDLADFYALSFWDKDPRRRFLKEERHTVLTVLDIIRQSFPDIEIIYKTGNHEERLERYLKVKAPEIYDMELTDFRAIIEADRFNIKTVEDRRLIKLGRFLYLIHGHEFGTSFTNPVNPARGLFLRGKANALCAHYHQTSSHTENSIDGTVVSCYSIGMLCNSHPEYCPINKWNLGFAIVDNDNGQFTVHNHKIIGGRVY